MFFDFKRRTRRKTLALGMAVVIVLAFIVAAAAAAGAALAALALDAARVNTASTIESKSQACDESARAPFSSVRGKSVESANAARQGYYVRHAVLDNECDVDVIKAVPASMDR